MSLKELNVANVCVALSTLEVGGKTGNDSKQSEAFFLCAFSDFVWEDPCQDARDAVTQATGCSEAITPPRSVVPLAVEEIEIWKLQKCAFQKRWC